MKVIEVNLIGELETKQQEIATKVAAYQTAQLYQLQHGGPGPVADYDIMEIVNEHAGEFQVIAKEQPQQEEPVQEE